MNIELLEPLSCPFCGNKIEVKIRGSNIYIECLKCFIAPSIASSFSLLSKMEEIINEVNSLVNKWNKRL